MLSKPPPCTIEKLKVTHSLGQLQCDCVISGHELLDQRIKCCVGDRPRSLGEENLCGEAYQVCSVRSDSSLTWNNMK